MGLPIVFIHRGYSDYMEYSLHQAKYSNPDSEIILLGDAANDRFDFITHVNMKDYFSSAAEFSKTYKHYSSNPYHYELFCVQRWFVLKEYMERNNIEKCFVCDTDVMIYSNIDKALIPFKKAGIAMLYSSNESFLLGISFLCLKNLKSFCIYALHCYNNDDNLKQFEKYYLDITAKNGVGGISDMTLTAFWLKETPCDNIMSLAEVKNDTIFDSYIGGRFQYDNDSYKFHRGRKAITWQNNMPYCYSYKYQKNIRFHILHFQGPAKYLMAAFYTGKSFSGKLHLDIKFFFANIAAFWYKILRIRYRFAWLFSLVFNFKGHNRKYEKN